MSNHTVNTLSTWAGGKSPFKISYGKLMMWFFLLSDAFTFSSLLVGYGAVRFSKDAVPEEKMEMVRQKLKFNDNVANYAAGAVATTHDATDAHGVAEGHEDAGHHFISALRSEGVFSADHWPAPELVFNHFPFLHGRHLPLMFVSLMTFILILSSVTMVLAVEAGQRMDKKNVQKYMIYTIIGGAMFLGCQAWEWTQFIGEGATLNGNPFGPVTFAALFFLVTGFHGFHVLSGVVLNIVIFLNVVKGTYEKRGHYEMVEKTGLYWHFVDLVWVFVFTFFYLI
ncbi:MAG: cytochrome c oxidase subunit 3 [Flavobacteriales bacterium]|nr:cytochrome c oxidase subunit 3 [Flavobacteriales bacterium]